MIEVRHVSYAPRRPLLDRVSLHVAPGECVGVIGDRTASAALLQIMNGILTPDAGTVHLRNGAQPARPRELQMATAFVRGDVLPGDELRVDEYLRFAAHTRPARDHAPGWPQAMVQRLGITSSTAIGRLNQDHRLMVALVAALASTANVVLVDHPLDALDEPVRAALKDCVMTARVMGRSVVVTARDEAVVTGFVDRAIQFDAGRTADTARPHSSVGPERC